MSGAEGAFGFRVIGGVPVVVEGLPDEFGCESVADELLLGASAADGGGGLEGVAGGVREVGVVEESDLEEVGDDGLDELGGEEASAEELALEFGDGVRSAFKELECLFAAGFEGWQVVVGHGGGRVVRGMVKRRFPRREG